MRGVSSLERENGDFLTLERPWRPGKEMERVSLKRPNGDFLYLERPWRLGREMERVSISRERKWKTNHSREALETRERDGEGLPLSREIIYIYIYMEKVSLTRGISFSREVLFLSPPDYIYTYIWRRSPSLEGFLSPERPSSSLPLHLLRTRLRLPFSV